MGSSKYHDAAEEDFDSRKREHTDQLSNGQGLVRRIRERLKETSSQGADI